MIPLLVLAGIAAAIALGSTRKKSPTRVGAIKCEFWIDHGFVDPHPLVPASSDPAANIAQLRAQGNVISELQLRCSHNGGAMLVQDRWAPGATSTRFAPPNASAAHVHYWAEVGGGGGDEPARQGTIVDGGIGPLTLRGTASEDARVADLWVAAPRGQGNIWRVTEDASGNQITIDKTHEWSSDGALIRVTP